MSKQEPLLVDKGCAERGCMGYDDRDGDKPVKMRVFEDDDDIQEYKKPWRGLTQDEQMKLLWDMRYPSRASLLRAVEAKLKELNS
jgi:hypothetical protein